MAINTKLNWYFPPTNGGRTRGFNNSGEEYFRSTPWEQAVREVIQNSLDAVDEGRNKPVIVNISEKKIPASEIGATDLAGHIKSALDTEEKRSTAGAEFYKNALKVLNQSKIDVLAITDTNTTGLKKEKWDALIFEEGTSSKDGITAAGGSFGIGKNAPYVVSALKTVCYTTRYLDGGRIEKFIAVCNISSHKDPKPPYEEILQNIGYGTKTKLKTDDNRAIPTEGNKIYPEFSLDECGSGIFIIGFNPRSPNWINEAKKSIARNFFVAIHERKLEVFINSDPINYQTLDGIFENGKKKEPARNYYHIIRGDTQKKIIANNFGRFTLQVSIDDENYHNSIAYINRRGMMITDKRIFDDNPFYSSVGKDWAKYVAVIRADDDETDNKIRDMEPPNHQSIEYKRILDKKNRDEIEEQLRDLRKKISDIINDELQKDITKRDIDLHELADILPFSSDSGEESPKQGDIEGGLKPRIVKSSISPTVNDEDEESDDEVDGESDKPGKRKGKSGEGHHKHKKNHHSQATPILQHRRIIRNKEGLQIAFTSGEKNGKPICFIIRPAGEQKMNEAMIALTSSQIKSTTNQTVTINNNRITITPKYNERVIIDLKIPQTKSYTGYEIVELNSEDKPPKGNEK